jgi:hypothetical protein
MNTKSLRCPICGYPLEPDQHGACAACPLGKSCRLICCPQCGFSTPRPGGSSWLDQLRAILKREAKHDTSQSPSR